MSDSGVLQVASLGSSWRTPDPFLFCVHHDDAYPAGDERLGPAASLDGRQIGHDFDGQDGWRMYHGDVVPGFPQHPHRGFETVTIVRRGYVDHSDSIGATARYGQGDVQWMTAGRGVVHSEMFPLLDRRAPNPLELFQLWINLPRTNKLVEPAFAMFWKEKLPSVIVRDAAGRAAEVTLYAGSFGGERAPSPPPGSWAADPRSDLAIWTLRLAPGASLTLPPAAAGSTRSLYFFRGGALRIGGRSISASSSVALVADASTVIESGDGESELLLLQGRPIGEPVAQHGPFVMTTRAELEEAFDDYRRTQFGGWRWPSAAPVHPREEGRFARFPDGRLERP